MKRIAAYFKRLALVVCPGKAHVRKAHKEAAQRAEPMQELESYRVGGWVPVVVGLRLES